VPAAYVGCSYRFVLTAAIRLVGFLPRELSPKSSLGCYHRRRKSRRPREDLCSCYASDRRIQSTVVGDVLSAAWETGTGQGLAAQATFGFGPGLDDSSRYIEHFGLLESVLV
jgi:hypothetical protein